MNNAILLQRAMSVLDLCTQDLALRLNSDYIDSITSQDTVRRWVNGASSVEPAALAWLAELLRFQALASTKSIITWPSKQSITICVANMKGGTGKTTVAINLAVVSQIDFGIYTTHYSSEECAEYHAIRDSLSRVGVKSLPLSQWGMENLSNARQINIVDIPLEQTHSALIESRTKENCKLRPDILLIPGDYGRRYHAAGARRTLGLDGIESIIRLLHIPELMNTDFANTCLEAGIDVTSELFLPFFIPCSPLGGSHIPIDRSAIWRNPEQKFHYEKLLEYIINLLGGSIMQPDEAAESIRDMDMKQLLDHME
ncbi:ParA family protein [Halomonas heilongjiangensis]|uniref:ParA family protein n=1 Tax=Halomonas heilongjiangensis TaxID=1387883 RepID=UPI0011AF8B55|nr:ParA family protein [Halomonas heilongjiangensis]